MVYLFQKPENTRQVNIECFKMFEVQDWAVSLGQDENLILINPTSYGILEGGGDSEAPPKISRNEL